MDVIPKPLPVYVLIRWVTPDEARQMYGGLPIIPDETLAPDTFEVKT